MLVLMATPARIQLSTQAFHSNHSGGDSTESEKPITPRSAAESGTQSTIVPGSQLNMTSEIASKNYPRAAFSLASLAALFMLFAGLIAIFFDSLYLAIMWSIWAGLTSLLIGIGLIICALAISGSAASMRVRPEIHRSAGVSILFISLIALLLGFGWIWLIGSGLGIIAGLLAIFWRPGPT